MQSPNTDANAGVQAGVGFDFQRNTCVYILLDQYNLLKNQNYFVMLEHYDDIVFAFNNDEGEISEVKIYQAKKSATVWTVGQLYEILTKMCDAGIGVMNDKLSKASDYCQHSYFITNNTITIEYKCSKSNKKLKAYVNETNDTVSYKSLHPDCQTVLKKGNKDFKFNSNQLIHLTNINFNYIDFGRNTKSQLQHLTGKFQEVFGNKISDHSAARDTLIKELKKIETTYNQGHQPKLSDASKKITSNKINEIINVITTKNLAIEFCRKKAEDICSKLLINVIDAMSFELDFENSLDNFKDLNQGEHQKIIHFIRGKKDNFVNFTDSVACIKSLHDDFISEQNSALSPTQLKAAIASGYFLTLTQK
ncbi:hypothetical protein [Hymenobacter koreensis]|uniref:CD-NTase associated protein 4-like DNA endonuclease domain-containing protein n=1 Tax=Hymenobacter koreensis TaxID=1084523 RepID=A0ABP8JPF5_9BACT